MANGDDQVRPMRPSGAVLRGYKRGDVLKGSVKGIVKDVAAAMGCDVGASTSAEDS